MAIHAEAYPPSSTQSNAAYSRRRTAQTPVSRSTPPYPYPMHPNHYNQSSHHTFPERRMTPEVGVPRRTHTAPTNGQNPFILRPASSFESPDVQRRERTSRVSHEVNSNTPSQSYTRRESSSPSSAISSSRTQGSTGNRTRHCSPEEEDETDEPETPPPPPPPRSEYDAPTCKFEWKRFRPVKQNPVGPKLFVDYREYSRGADPLPVSAPPSRSPSPPLDPEPAPMPPQRRQYLPLSSLGEMAPRRAPSTVSNSSSCNSSDASTSASRLTPAPPLSPHLGRGTAPGIIAPVPRHDPVVSIDLDDLHIAPSAPGTPDIAHMSQAHSASSGPIRRPVQRRRPSPIANVGDRREAHTEWLDHVGIGEDRGAKTLYTCLWEEVTKDGKTKLCGFEREKSSVKRHVEAIHLKYKPHACSYCPMRFSQKTALKTHINTHTGATPNKCLYCDKEYSDPARRHRHMTNDHGHVSYRKHPKPSTTLPERHAVSQALTA